MGSCIRKHSDDDPSMDKTHHSVEVKTMETHYNDTPYDERSKDEILESQTRQMIQNMNRRHGFD